MDGYSSIDWWTERLVIAVSVWLRRDKYFGSFKICFLEGWFNIYNTVQVIFKRWFHILIHDFTISTQWQRLNLILVRVSTWLEFAPCSFPLSPVRSSLGQFVRAGKLYDLKCWNCFEGVEGKFFSPPFEFLPQESFSCIYALCDTLSHPHPHTHSHIHPVWHIHTHTHTLSLSDWSTSRLWEHDD